MQRPQIPAPLDDAAAAGEQLSSLFGKAGGLGGFLRAEAVLALGGKDVGDAAAVGLDDLLVEVDELLPSLSANARPTVDFPLEGIPMRATLSISRRSAAVMRPISPAASSNFRLRKYSAAYTACATSISRPPTATGIPASSARRMSSVLSGLYTTSSTASSPGILPRPDCTRPRWGTFRRGWC